MWPFKSKPKPTPKPTRYALWWDITELSNRVRIAEIDTIRGEDFICPNGPYIDNKVFKLLPEGAIFEEPTIFWQPLPIPLDTPSK